MSVSGRSRISRSVIRADGPCPSALMICNYFRLSFFFCAMFIKIAIQFNAIQKQKDIHLSASKNIIIMLIILFSHFKESLAHATNRANIRCFSADYQMATGTAFPDSFLTLFKHSLHFHIFQQCTISLFMRLHENSLAGTF